MGFLKNLFKRNKSGEKEKPIKKAPKPDKIKVVGKEPKK